MSPELQERLKGNFPLTLSSGSEICCKDGWFKLIWDLTALLEKINSSLPESQHVIASQIKQKFGNLRYNTNLWEIRKLVSEKTISKISVAIDEAMNKSLTICEVCGDTVICPNPRLDLSCSSRRKIYRLITACDKHLLSKK